MCFVHPFAVLQYLVGKSQPFRWPANRSEKSWGWWNSSCSPRSSFNGWWSRWVIVFLSSEKIEESLISGYYILLNHCLWCVKSATNIFGKSGWTFAMERDQCLNNLHQTRAFPSKHKAIHHCTMACQKGVSRRELFFVFSNLLEAESYHESRVS